MPLALVMAWATMGSARVPAHLADRTDVQWQAHETAHLTFSLPAHWAVTTHDDGSLRLAGTGRDGGATIDVAFLPEAPATLTAIERLGVVRIERDATIARHFLRIDQRARIAAAAAARIRYTADRTDGARVEAIWLARPLPDGRLLSVTLTVPEGTYFKSADALFRRFVQSVMLIP